MGLIDKREIIYNYFINNPNKTISEIAEETGISSSSVQRYLQYFANRIIPTTGLTVHDQLQHNKKEGLRKGGINSFRNNDSTKNEAGLFSGSTPTATTYDKEERKRQDIIMICNYFMDHYPITLNQMAEDLGGFGYTKDYIHKCLHDDRVVELIGVEKSRELSIKFTTIRKDLRPQKGNTK